MQAMAGMQAKAVTLATNNSNDDRNSMTAQGAVPITGEMQATAGMKATTRPPIQKGRQQKQGSLQK
jgi:hypothetical protein